jgi:hypothetical protein
MQKKSWDPHGAEGWYLGPTMEHYRYYQVFTDKTKAERITDTVKFFPQHTKVPYMSSTDVAIQAASNLIMAIQQPTPEIQQSLLIAGIYIDKLLEGLLK